MGSSGPAFAALALSALVLSGCGSTGGRPDPDASLEPAALVGETTRPLIEAAKPEWVEETVLAEPDLTIADGLLEVEAAELKIVFGTWCSDSRRELARFWRVLDSLPVEPSLSIHYVAVDRAKKEPREHLAGLDLLYVPTFVVSRDGREIGRVIEESPHGIESDLLALLSGRESGWISARDDLPAGSGGE